MPPPSEYRLPPIRAVLVVVAVFAVLSHFSAVHHSESYSASVSSVRDKLGLGSDGMPLGARVRLGQAAAGSMASHGASMWNDDRVAELNSSTRANATFFILARNSDVWDILKSIRGMEDRFNHKHHYPYVFLNDQPFDDDFKRLTSSIASGPCSYGLVPKEHWEEPAWIDETKAAAARQKMAEEKVIYGDSKVYRRMCRYESGFFYRHELLRPYKYYWRLDPNVQYCASREPLRPKPKSRRHGLTLWSGGCFVTRTVCDLDYDPFRYMQDHGKKYGWTISLYEYEATIPTLWQHTKDFIDRHPQYLPEQNLMEWISPDQGKTYNRCHFWSNFEIADLDFFRGEAYSRYFDHLDRAGGFSYERWGDAPIHSIAAALFMKRDQVHWFHDLGYRHEPFQHCPQSAKDRCACDPRSQQNFESHWYSCTPKYKELQPDWKAFP
ncbi:hypothetical protein BMF94_6699 [Rhodotorula taiwanensis]|uniref:Uncharacterized protein n=1 Tax=Rhodotorula taiwanensis TaxID=741276 RepID=A0A2S5B0J0_9BASI|nr:hypothetical protein BMF94_6699 [Rhodotorula taiwanensis]